MRGGGVEPPWNYPPDPKSGASASSATLALSAIYYTARAVSLTTFYKISESVRFSSSEACLIYGVREAMETKQAKRNNEWPGLTLFVGENTARLIVELRRFVQCAESFRKSGTRALVRREGIEPSTC